MTSAQRVKLTQLGSELAAKRGLIERITAKGEKDGYVFTEVQGVTVIITKVSRNPRGGYKIPAVRTYDEVFFPTNLDAAVRADELFSAQASRDRLDIAAAKNLKTGHLGPIIKTNWKCVAQDCVCQCETEARRKSRSLQ